jgi:hypothetical protein
MNPSELIDKEIADHPDWRGQTMAEIRRIIRETVPDVTEEWKWMGTPTWSHNGILCICNAFKEMVKVTFINGAKLASGPARSRCSLHDGRDNLGPQKSPPLAPRAMSSRVSSPHPDQVVPRSMISKPMSTMRSPLS